MTLEFTAAVLTDTGRVREGNEDMPLLDDPNDPRLVGVADGMGGHEGGEVASKLAVDTVLGWKERLVGRSGREAADLLREAFTEANRVVFEKGVEDQSLLGMGTTLTVGWLDSGTLSLAHVGDSRAYLLRAGDLEQLTEDQTVAQEWVRRGRLSEEEAAASPHRHILLQAIGADTDKLDIVITQVALRPGDRLMFASDGLTGMVKETSQLRDLLVEHADPNEACRALVDAANAAGGEDNISVVLIDVGGEADADIDVVDAGDEDEVLVERSTGVAAKRAKKRPGRRSIVVAAAFVLLAAMAFVLFIVRPSASAFVVAARHGRVVVLKGQPGDGVTEAAKGKVLKTYKDAKVKEFPTTVQRELHSGIVVESIGEADDVVDRLPRQLGPQDTPRPSPKQTPEPSPEASPEPGADQ